MAGREDIPTDTATIGATAERVRKLAIKITGEKELGYIPLNSPYSDKAGQRWDGAAGAPLMGKYGLYSMDDKSCYNGTAAQWAALEDQYKWIPGEFESRYEPDPDRFDLAIVVALGISEALYTSSETGGWKERDISDVPGKTAIADPLKEAKEKTSNCAGYFAETFDDQYMAKLEPVAIRHAAIASVLHGSLEATQATYLEARRTLSELAHQTEAALSALIAGKSLTFWAKPEAPVVFAYIAAAATILAGVATLGTGTAPAVIAVAGFTSIAGASAAGSTFAGEQAKIPDLKLEAATANGVITNMVEGLTTLTNTLKDAEDAIAKALNTNIGVIDANQGDAFLPPRPKAFDKRGDDLRDGFRPPVTA